MKSTKQIFHILSYLQYPLMIMAIYFVTKPIFDGSAGSSGDLKLVLKSLNNMLIFMGLAISFASLQDTSKTSMKFEKKIWENPKKGRRFIIYMAILPLLALGFGIFGYFISHNEHIKEVAFGSIVLGIGLIGFLKAGIEVFENHRRDKKEERT